MIGRLAQVTAQAIIDNTDSFGGKYRLLRTLGQLCKNRPIVSRYGVVLGADLSDKTNYFAITGAYGDAIIREINLVEPGSAFIDIGANAGLFSIAAAKAVGENGIVLAFEPQRRVASRLRQNIQLNNVHNVWIFELALGSLTGRLAFAAPDGHSGLGHIDPAGSELVYVASPSLLLPLVKNMVGNRKICLKIDVEGAEADVINSLIPLFDCLRVQKCIVEIDANLLSRFGAQPGDIYKMFSSLGFKPTSGRSEELHYDEVFEIGL